jgi:hypothetical protein
MYIYHVLFATINISWYRLLKNIRWVSSNTHYNPTIKCKLQYFLLTILLFQLKIYPIRDYGVVPRIASGIRIGPRKHYLALVAIFGTSRKKARVAIFGTNLFEHGHEPRYQIGKRDPKAGRA